MGLLYWDTPSSCAPGSHRCGIQWLPSHYRQSVPQKIIVKTYHYYYNYVKAYFIPCSTSVLWEVTLLTSGAVYATYIYHQNKVIHNVIILLLSLIVKNCMYTPGLTHTPHRSQWWYFLPSYIHKITKKTNQSQQYQSFFFLMLRLVPWKYSCHTCHSVCCPWPRIYYTVHRTCSPHWLGGAAQEGGG